MFTSRFLARQARDLDRDGLMTRESDFEVISTCPTSQLCASKVSEGLWVRFTALYMLNHHIGAYIVS
jgi:hypothetical protein